MTSAMPGTRPSCRAYPPPVPVGFIDPGGTTPVEHALRTQQAVAQAYTDWRAAHPQGIDPDTLRDNAGAFSVSDAALQLPEVLKPVKDQADAANGKVKELMSGSRVAADDVAAQLAAQRFWNRTQRTLDTIKDPSSVAAAARDMIANASDAEIPFISEELASYLATRSVPTGWLTDALAGKIPGLSDAQADAILLARHHAVLAANHQNLTRAMAKDTSPAPLLNPYAVSGEAYDGGSYSPGAEFGVGAAAGGGE
jgi:hypothetical protein